MTAAAVILSFLFAAQAMAAGLTLEKKADGYTISAMIDRNPPSVGPNNLAITLKDAAGKPVTDAKIQVVYSMPAMPGMPAMEYKVIAKLDGGQYKAVADFSMPGAWNLEVKVKLTGVKKLVKAGFNVDVR